MTNEDDAFVWPHEDPPFFKQAINATAVRTGFTRMLIEKDYFCTVLLSQLSKSNCGIVFKGGTCLAKVMVDFYRLSEDLDFVIPLPADASRKKRRQGVAPIKQILSNIATVFVGCEKFVGANNSTQYTGSVQYLSYESGKMESIKIDVSLREPLLVKPKDGSVNTILLHPLSNQPFNFDVTFPCIDFKEGFAEKMRAALTRREIAIRDFYDIDYAVINLGLDVNDKGFRRLLKTKLSVPGTGSVKIGQESYEKLHSQLEGRLKPVLRTSDYRAFDLKRAFDVVKSVLPI